MPRISLDAEIIRGNRISINISPLCGDDQPKFSQTTQPTTFRAKPLTAVFLPQSSQAIQKVAFDVLWVWRDRLLFTPCEGLVDESELKRKPLRKFGPDERVRLAGVDLERSCHGRSPHLRMS